MEHLELDLGGHTLQERPLGGGVQQVQCPQNNIRWQLILFMLINSKFQQQP